MTRNAIWRAPIARARTARGGANAALPSRIHGRESVTSTRLAPMGHRRAAAPRPSTPHAMARKRPGVVPSRSRSLTLGVRLGAALDQANRVLGKALEFGGDVHGVFGWERGGER